MVYFISFILIITVVLTFIKPIYGLASFIAVRILVPEVARTPGIDSLSLNSSIIGIIAIFVFAKKLKYSLKKTLTDKFSLVLLLFIAYNALVLPLSNYGSLAEQYNLLLKFFLTDILPIILCIIIIKDECDVNVIKRVFLFSTTICCLYGIVTYIAEFNPYVLVFSVFYQWRDAGDTVNQVLLDGRGYGTSGTFIHANGFGYFISMSIPLVAYFIYCNRKDKLAIFTLVLLILNIFLCKKKSPIVSMSVFSLFLLLMAHSKLKIKYYLEGLGVVLFLFILIETVPSLESIKNVIESSLQFWNDNVSQRSNVGGSSWELRIRQFTYPFVEISSNPIFGHGFGWCSWYLKEYELHPILFGFETILATAVCECGIMGYFVYYFLFKKCYKYSSMYKLQGINFALLNIIAELTLVIATGLNYFYFFTFGVVLFNRIGHIRYEKEENIDSNSHLQLL